MISEKDIQQNTPRSLSHREAARRLRWQYATAAGMLVFGCALAAAAMFLPPQGKIDGSVLGIFAQCVIYAGSIFGVGAYITERFRELSAGTPSNSGKSGKSETSSNSSQPE